MLKYIIFAIIVVLLIFNYTAEKILSLVLKKDVEEKQVIIFKCILYVIILAGTITIMLL